MCRWNSHQILGVPYGITLWHNQIWYPISNPNRPSLLRRHFFLGSLRPRVTSTLPWGVRSLSATLTRNILMCSLVVEPPFLPSKNYYPTVISHGNLKKKKQFLGHCPIQNLYASRISWPCSITEGHHLSQLGSSCTNPRCKDSGNLSWFFWWPKMFLKEDGDISVQ